VKHQTKYLISKIAGCKIKFKLNLLTYLKTDVRSVVSVVMMMSVMMAIDLDVMRRPAAQ
jgi:hypothetical protein